MWSSEPQIVLLAETISTTSYFKLPKKINHDDLSIFAKSPSNDCGLNIKSGFN